MRCFTQQTRHYSHRDAFSPSLITTNDQNEYRFLAEREAEHSVHALTWPVATRTELMTDIHLLSQLTALYKGGEKDNVAPTGFVRWMLNTDALQAE